MLICCWDSLRPDKDIIDPFKGIFGENESWTEIPCIDGFTGPILPAIVTGKSPEELEIPRDESAFWSGINPKNIDDTLFDYFDSYITISRLIGPKVNPNQTLVPSRRGMEKFMPPINWNAVSNWDVHIWEYLGKKWSLANPYWIDVIFFWSFFTHGSYSIYDSLGALESPEIISGDLLNNRLARTNPEKLKSLYMMGVYNAVETLKGLNEICGGNELIICFSDHPEALGEEYNGRILTGHFAGMHRIPRLGTVPLWINRPNVEFPEDMNQLKLKDFIIDCYERYEKHNPEYLAFKRWKLQRAEKEMKK